MSAESQDPVIPKTALKGSLRDYRQPAGTAQNFHLSTLVPDWSATLPASF